MFAKRRSLILAAVGLTLLVLSLTGCVKPSQEVVVEQDMNGERVKLAAGQALVVMLPASPGTGYSWQVEGELDEAVLRMTGEPEFTEIGLPTRPLTGQGEAEILRFEAVGAGKLELILVYHRPWEEGVDPLEVFSLSVEVK